MLWFDKKGVCAEVIHFQKIYTSALQRTQQSVLPFIEAGKPYQVFSQLNEISWGVFEGKPQNETERKASQRKAGGKLAKGGLAESLLKKS